MAVDSHAEILLRWYDAHARSLPWRSPPSAPPPDPYRVWLSEIMLQQTTVAAVAPYFAAFTTRWPTVRALAAAADADVMAAWAGLGYYARARNLLACARAVAARGGFPTTEADLLTLPGIGPYTAAAIASIAFDRRAVVVDGNVERVIARLFAAEIPLPTAKPALRTHADRLTPDARPGDYAQAMMDLGATICTPRSPKCLLCPLRQTCAAFATGDPETFPRKSPKPAKPVRYGTIFWLTSGDRVLTVIRPPKGLLGGMTALPTGPWTSEPPDLEGAPAPTDWRWRDGEIRHVFTHFELRLRVAVAEVVDLPGGTPISDLDRVGLPTVFAKAARLALA
jgi:A/G-specific adenine glycosylase